MSDARKDLAVLVADKCTEQAVRGLLGRTEALGIRGVSFDVFVHPDSDPGCLHKSQELLRPLHGQYDYALVIFDLEGSGGEARGRQAIEDQVRQSLERSGWQGRAEAVVVEPELETWVWSDSPQVDVCLGWSGRLPTLRQWLSMEGLWDDQAAKPKRPKEAFEAALEEVKIPLSSSLFGDLAESVSVNRCKDTSFLALRAALTRWFGGAVLT